MVTAPDTRYRISAEQFLAMVESGILPAKPRLELLRGELWRIPVQTPLHRALVVLLHDALLERYPFGPFHVAARSTIWALPDSLPEPDLAVVRGDAELFLQRLPRPEDTVLVGEVVVTTMAVAREKAGLYAEAGFPLYLLVDAVRRTCDVYSEPGPDGYRLTRHHAVGDPMALPEARAPLDLGEVFPAAASEPVADQA
ncbi:MAG: Uma2 family endonuclease [Myxococcota bacterium]